jgi:hypothetical protein
MNETQMSAILTNSRRVGRRLQIWYGSPLSENGRTERTIMNTDTSQPSGASKTNVGVTLVECNGQARSFHVANLHASVLRPLLC